MRGLCVRTMTIPKAVPTELPVPILSGESWKKKKVRSSMRGSPELLTGDLGENYSKSASPIAFADIRNLPACMRKSSLCVKGGALPRIQRKYRIHRWLDLLRVDRSMLRRGRPGRQKRYPIR